MEIRRTTQDLFEVHSLVEDSLNSSAVISPNVRIVEEQIGRDLDGMKMKKARLFDDPPGLLSN